MPLQSGTRIGGYEIVALLGAGGMGEVYRARDARLGRDVAIKILSPQIAADADALSRFEREARALASLNHPNIGAIYGVEDHNAQPALILELVEGETIADRIAAGPVAIDTAIDYARQIAEALDVAHEAGIVHRDLKPGNIKITDDGRSKVLDFGLAKAIAIAAGELPDLDPVNSPTITVRGTKHGLILGTAAYMSPEQARGKRIDKRTDIWAFGCVLFEMLTAKRAFGGETTSDVIAAIIERAPDLSLLPRDTPSHVRRVIARCLDKDPKRRARDIADVRVELDREAAPHAVPRPRSRVMVTVFAAIAIAALVSAVAAWRLRPGPAPPAPAIEFTFGAPNGYALMPVPGVPSPDGSRIAFVARDDKNVPSIFVRPLDAVASRRVDGTEGVINAPVWSPDGRSLAFFVGGVWKRIPADGGPPVTIVSGLGANLGASWGANDLLLLAPANRTSLSRVAASGGSLQQVTTLDTAKDNSHRWPYLLPDGKHYLFTVRSDSPERLGIKLGALESTEIRGLLNVASPAIYTAPEWLLFITPDEVLMAQRLDPATWTLQGTPQPVAGPVRYFGPSFSGLFHASSDGRVLTYVPAVRAGSTLEWFDRAGKPLGRVGPERAYSGIRLSPDGRRVAVELADPQVGTRDLWMLDTVTGALTRFTSHPATDWRAAFSPDGSSVAFASDRAGASKVFRAGVANPGGETRLYEMADSGVFPIEWSADGNDLFLAADRPDGRSRGVVKLSLASGTAVPLMASDPGDGMMPRVSPQGDRIAFASRESGAVELYVISAFDSQRVRVSTDGGSNPVWGPDGKELFFQNPRGELMRAVLNGTGAPDKPQTLFRLCASVNRTYTATVTEIAYDISADGRRFLAICDPEDVVPSAINVIVNWQSKLK